MSDSFSIKIEGLEDLLKDAEKAGGILPSLLYQAMVASTTTVQNKARSIGVGSFKNRTGTLRRSIQRTVESSARGVVHVGEKYGEYVEFGTSPHVIYPKKAKMLSFTVDGKKVFARRVNHPGSRAYPFMEPAFRDSQPIIQKEYERVAETVVKTIAG